MDAARRSSGTSLSRMQVVEARSEVWSQNGMKTAMGTQPGARQSIHSSGHGGGLARPLFDRGTSMMTFDDAHETSVLVTDRRTAERRKAGGGVMTATKTDDGAVAAPVTERREKVERRRQIDPTTCERDYSQDEVEFMNAMNDYKRRSGRQFPTWSEVLEVLRAMGYRRVEEPVEVQF